MDDTQSVEISKLEGTPTIWKWYFGWHPRIFLTVPAFLMFVYNGLWFLWYEIQDVISFFKYTPVTWGSILLILLFGSVLIWFIIGPIFICFYSIPWLYKVNTEDYSPWKKFLYSIGIVVLVPIVASLVRMLVLWLVF